MIYVIGDSHVCFFLGDNRRVWRILGKKKKSNYPFFEVHYVESGTAYNLVIEDSTSGSGSKVFDVLENISIGSTLLFCFGEIDCREHLPKHQNIDECVERYLDFVSEIKEVGYKVLLWGVTSKNQNKIVEEFNRKLKIEAKKYGIEVINIYKKIVDKNEYFLQDKVHLSQNAMPLVIDELKRKSLV